MLPRCFAPSLSEESSTVTLSADEATHLLRVLRLGVGDAVRVFDGRGIECLARVSRTTKSVVDLSIDERVVPAPEMRVTVTLAQALLKTDKFDAVVRDATMLGVVAVRPLMTARVDVPEAAVRDGGRLDRWRRVAIASAKQCGRAVVPTMHAVASLAECLAADASAERVLMAEPSAGMPDAGASGDRVSGDSVEALRAQAPPASALVLVGPEGGWSSDELARARAAGCRIVTLGNRTFRADTAPLIVLAVLQYVWGEFAQPPVSDASAGFGPAS
jgi:16S rRNA (uracil1498-N3)-methyltransferase